MAIVNGEKRGTNSANTLINDKKGYTYLTGLKGDDTYVIEDISNSFTEIDDSDRLDEYAYEEGANVNQNGIPTDNYGTDTVQIKNVKPNELALFFDVSLEKYDFENVAYDDFFIVKKSEMTSVLNQFLAYEEAWGELEPDYYEQGYSEKKIEQMILSQAAPQSGAVYIPYQFGDTNNGGSQMSASAIEKIQVVDSQTGEVKTLNTVEYMENVKQQVEVLLTEIYNLGLQDSYGSPIVSAIQLLTSEHTEYVNRLIEIYKNQNFEQEVSNEPEDDNSEVVPQPPVDDPEKEPVIEVPANVLLFKEGDGHSVITPKKGGPDTMRFEGFDTWNDISCVKNKNDLIIYYGKDNLNDNSVTIKNYLSNPYKSPIQNIEFTNNSDNSDDAKYNMAEEIIVNVYGEDGKKNNLTGTKLNDDIFGGDMADALKGGDGDDWLIGGEGDDKLYGGAGENVYYFNKGDGNDVVYYDKNASDILYFNEVSLNSLHLEKGKNNGIKIVTEDGDSVELANYLNKGITSVSKIYGYDSVDSTSLQEFLNDKYIYQFGDEKNNKLTGTNYADLIRGGEGNDTINGGDGNDSLKGDAGADTIKGENGNDDIIGGAGNDKLYGGAGENTFHFSKGDGEDLVYYSKNASDTLYFTDVRMNELHIEKGKGNGLKIVTKYGDSVELVDYLKKAQTSVDYIETAIDKQSLTLDEFLNGKPIYQSGDFKNNKLSGTSISDEIHGGEGNDTISGKDGDDVLYGDAGNDTIKGGNGDDHIYGGTGDDKLYGEASSKGGANYFYFTDGDGHDTIYMGKGTDKIHLETPQGKAPVYGRDKNNLVISYGEGDTITISNYFTSKNPSLSSLEYSVYDSELDKYVNKVDQIDKIIVKGELENYAGFKLYYYEGNEENNLIYANSNYDEIDTGDGDNVVYINSKKEAAVLGGCGDDVYYVNSLQSGIGIFDAGGSDKLVINDKSSNINVLFNVNANKSPIDNTFSSMLIVNDANLNKIKKSWSFENISQGVEVLNNNSGIEYIYSSKDNMVLDVIELKNTIASWLTSDGRNYASAMDVIQQQDPNDIKALLAVYQNAWTEVN